MRDLGSLLAIFRCPETRRPIDLVGEETIDRLNDAIADRELRSLGGELIERPIEAALRPEGTDFAYPVRDGIPDFSPTERVPI